MLNSSDYLIECGYKKELEHITHYETIPNDQSLTIVNHKHDIQEFLKDSDIVFNNFLDIFDSKYENSWNKNIGDIDPDEILEATLINQLMPTLIINEVIPYMKCPKFVINVTCLEGQFDTRKTSCHPHTNMCKSAMNMLIKTLSELSETKQNQIYSFAIDPGFVSGVLPQHENFPLTPLDGASRILDPIIQYYSGSPLPRDWIKLRNYMPCKW